MRFVALFAAATLLCSCLPAQQNMFFNERAIKKLPVPGTDSEVDKARCGDYLFYWADPQGVKPKGPRLGYIAEPMSGDPADTSFVFTFLKSKFVFITDASKEKPTAKVEMKDGTVTLITVRISPQDRKKAACITQ